MIIRSLNVPGSPSAAFTTTGTGLPAGTDPRTVLHFEPVGNPAPPRPRSPEAATSSISASGSTLRAAARPLPPPFATYASRSGHGVRSSTDHTNELIRGTLRGVGRDG